MPKRQSVELTRRAIEAARPGEWLWDGGARGIPGLGLRVTPGGTKTFLFRYRTSSGTQRFVKLGGYPALTVDQVRELAKLRAGEVGAGGDPSKARRALRDAPTMAELADYYLGPYAASKPLQPGSIQAARIVLRYSRPTLGNLKVLEVSPADVRRARAKVKADGIAAAEANRRARAQSLAEAEKAVAEAERAVAAAEARGQRAGTLRMILSGKRRKAQRAAALARRAEDWARTGRAGIHQANRLLAVLSTMFSVAIEQGWRAENPCKSIKKEQEDERWRNLSEAEVGRLLDACDVYEAENGLETTARGAADAVRLLLFTGARLREVLRAEWRQFDLERGLWEKPSAHTKVKRQHWLELEGPALDLLREMYERRGHARFLFPGDPSKGRAGKRVNQPLPLLIKPRVDLKRPWLRLVELAGLEDVRIHDLRRTTASFMLSGGASLATVGKSLGHTQPRTTARYAHLQASVQREGLRVAGEKMASLRAKAGTASVVLFAGSR